MALANFFDKTALAAAQVLRGFDRDAFAAALESQTVGIAFDGAAARSPEGRLTLELAANLLARLYPRLAIVHEGPRTGKLATDLAAAARAINPAIELAHDLTGVSACVAVGVTPVAAPVPTVYVGSDAWVVRLSPHEPVVTGASHNPFGAGAAACFGAANIFRMLFGEQLPRAEVDAPFAMSLLDYDPRADAPANPSLRRVGLGEAHLVGLGAIGNGVVWALARTLGLHGRLHLVDHECVDLSNLQRYILATQADRGTAKVTVAERALAGTLLTVHPHPQRWGEYLASRNDWRLERVLLAVDSASDRRTVQAALPRWVANAWTQPGDLGVSRHAFLGADACLMCLYLPTAEQKNDDQLVAEAIGLPQAVEAVRTLLYSGAPVGRAFIEQVATARGMPVEPLLPFADRPLRTFYTEAVCGGLLLKFGGGDGDARAEVPMAFQSALAGIMLAAELVAHAGDLMGDQLRVTTRIDLLRPLGRDLSIAEKKHPSGRCICQDQDYIAAYQAKYGIGLSTTDDTLMTDASRNPLPQAVLAQQKERWSGGPPPTSLHRGFIP